MLYTLIKVFRHPRYTLTATSVAVSVFVFAVWLPNVRLIISVLSSEVGTVVDKVTFLLSLLGSISTNFTGVSATVTVLIAILFGINVTLLIYYIKKMRVGSANVRSLSGISMAGLISGFLGVGCAACGTFILTSVLVLIGAGGVLVYLPFGGEEFSLIGIVLLLYSIFRLTRKIEHRVCEIF